MTEPEPRHLAEVYPALVHFLETALMDLGEHAFVDAVSDLPFLGWCRCKPDCNYFQTGDAEAAGSAWIHIDDDDAPRVWLQLDRDCAAIVGMEIHDFELS
ncbi:hypothetical protein KGA66_05260 [Actinocrinis puniceicyclus]|uniref:Uncharacterized protein n=1 Tax=Actinocrinis puniceicyclus TaxID=977794 RepID=A0A8J7WHQ9_9ACTN|nr:hypothetical protein [Actinocrinis puniceicyclus]MBS2962443.1 hypothetical protein [Actinocrinis puniceicyclus]